MHIMIHFEVKNLRGGDDLFVNPVHESFLDKFRCQVYDWSFGISGLTVEFDKMTDRKSVV